MFERGGSDEGGTEGDSDPLLFGFFFSFSNSVIAEHLTVYCVAVTEFIADHSKPWEFTGKDIAANLKVFLVPQ